MEDCKIVQLYWDRDETAITETSNKYERYLTKVANNILADVDDSAEAVNDTYLNAWNSMPPHKPDMLSTFLAKITRRLSIDKWRKKTADKRGGTEYDISLQELQESGFEPGEEASIESEESLLGELISKYLKDEVTKDARIMFVCRYFHNDSIKEICDKFNYGESKVKSSLLRTRKGLRDYLAKEGYEG